MAKYGEFLYGMAFYGLSGALPTSTDFDIFDFCYPTEAMMLTFVAYSEVSPQRIGAPYSWYNVDNDFCMFSDDEADSGFRVDVPVPTDSFTVQFSLLPTDLPYDFSDTTASRLFVGAFNRFGKMLGILISEMGGIALAVQGDGDYSVLPDSADIFDEVTAGEVLRLYNSSTALDQRLYSFTGNRLGWYPLGNMLDHFPIIANIDGGAHGLMTNMESGDIVADAPSA